MHRRRQLPLQVDTQADVCAVVDRFGVATPIRLVDGHIEFEVVAGDTDPEMFEGMKIHTGRGLIAGFDREQEPIGALDPSLVRRCRPGFRAYLDLNHYPGGHKASLPRMLVFSRA